MAVKKSRMRSEEGGERVTVYLDPELARSMRVHCAGERLSLSAFVSDAVREWLKRKASRGK